MLAENQTVVSNSSIHNSSFNKTHIVLENHQIRAMLIETTLRYDWIERKQNKVAKLVIVGFIHKYGFFLEPLLLRLNC
jgi:hypothetical protein